MSRCQRTAIIRSNGNATERQQLAPIPANPYNLATSRVRCHDGLYTDTQLQTVNWRHGPAQETRQRADPLVRPRAVSPVFALHVFRVSELVSYRQFGIRSYGGMRRERAQDKADRGV